VDVALADGGQGNDGPLDAGHLPVDVASFLDEVAVRVVDQHACVLEPGVGLAVDAVHGAAQVPHAAHDVHAEEHKAEEFEHLQDPLVHLHLLQNFAEEGVLHDLLGHLEDAKQFEHLPDAGQPEHLEQGGVGHETAVGA